MRIKDGFLLRQIDDSYMVVPLSKNIIDFGSIIKLTETGAFLWGILEKGADEETLITSLCNEYEVDLTSAKADTEHFIKKLTDADLLE